MRDDAGLLATFFSASDCMDRLAPRSGPLTPSSVGPVWPNVGKAWSRESDDALLAMYRAGEPYAHMARKLGRTSRAVNMRLYMLGYGRP